MVSEHSTMGSECLYVSTDLVNEHLDLTKNNSNIRQRFPSWCFRTEMELMQKSSSMPSEWLHVFILILDVVLNWVPEMDFVYLVELECPLHPYLW